MRVHPHIPCFSVPFMLPSFGLGSTTDVLTCFGLGGFLRLLVFWMLLPIVLSFAIFIGCLAHLVIRCKLSRIALLETSLPLILQLLFIFYPIVTNTAFEAFSCYTFDYNTNNTRAYLVSDVGIECHAGWGGSTVDSEEHLTVISVAFGAAAAYPLGLFVLNAVLLFSCRKAILSGTSTPLSRATSFLHREYEPQFYFWELMEVRNICTAPPRPLIIFSRDT